LGEGATLSRVERDRVLETCLEAVGERAYIVAGISSLSTAEAVAMAQSAVLPFMRRLW
jgi:dihydrodipicolinate synthase/N-acetylneuraminate lyase